MSRPNPKRPVVTAAALALLTACGGGGDGTGPDPTPNPVSTVTVSPPAASLAPQETIQLSAVVKDAAGATLTGRTVTWSTSAPAQASVSNTGLVTALTAGTATITATSEGKSGSAAVTIIAPVATVTVSPATSELVPQQTVQLTPVLKDAGGVTLSGRNVGWSSSQTAVATVSNSGLVTAAATGTTTITAVSEGQSGTAQVTVSAGAVVGTTGGTITVDNGNIVVTVPQGAVNAVTAITVTTLPQPTVPLPGNTQRLGAVYRLGPAGQTFSQPVTVKLKYDRNSLPAWAMAGDLSIQRLAGSQWGSLTDIVVDGQANTVTGKTSGFVASGSAARRGAGPGSAALAVGDQGSDVTIQALNPHAVLAPASGSVNFQQRAVTFHVGLEPRGAAIPAGPVPQPAGNPGLYKFRWTTTGQNGVLGAGGKTTGPGWSTQSEMQYVATNPVLNQLSGQIDAITVEVLLNPAAEANPTARDIASTSAAIDADLKITWQVQPDDKTFGRSEAGTFELQIRDQTGAAINLPDKHEVKWSASTEHGDIPNPAGLPPTQTTITYKAHSTFNSAPPRIDRIVATINRIVTKSDRVPVWGGLFGLQLMEMKPVTKDTSLLMKADTAFATVKVNYQVKFLPATSTIGPGGTKQLEVTLDPPNEIPAANLAYRFVNSANQGTLSVANNVQTTNSTVTYTAKAAPSGGTDQIQAEALSVLPGLVVLESIGTKSASVEVDPWATATFSIFTMPTGAHPEGFVAARISIPKIPGATSYQVEAASTPDGPYNKTFSGAETANQQSVNQVIDGGNVWHINVAAGFSSTQLGVDGRKAAYQNGYGGVLYKYKATQ